MNKKLLSIMLVIITSISLIGVTALFIITNFMTDKANAKEKEPSIDEVIEYSFDLPEITTNLASDNIVRLSFKLETDSKKAKEELEKREFQVRDIIISELSNISAEQLDGKDGMNAFKETVKQRANNLMQKGKIQKVYTTSYIIQ
ncbi:MULTISPECIES: flagellar basal body-associated protein FliL [Bacillaceae]|uniref:flagellar basal body-associated protein FliL n=1 Tax=Bacillaceae TaxID=186817 RepID=UPI000C76030C|nr:MULTISPECIES: flagellar basal body-associated protein FliL [Bacillaceae]PLR69758.1 flagellar basal body-associated protein FliL [Bacillus sp. UMB0893]QNG58767.1 flagellar basal body-associated protein FliL [Bacillus sp. PAMC26568]